MNEGSRKDRFPFVHKSQFIATFMIDKETIINLTETYLQGSSSYLVDVLIGVGQHDHGGDRQRRRGWISTSARH